MAASDRLSPFVGQRNMALQTKKRDGTWVSTPVNLVVDDDRILFRTWASSGKAKRLANFSEVRCAPSDARGRPRGSEVTGQATQLEGEGNRRAAELIDRRYPILQGWAVRLAHRLKHYRTVHYEITDVA
jgi:PPOX class probable F420-dependent enzyme